MSSTAPPAKLDAERLKRETRPELVLEQAKARFGIDPTKYTTSVGKDGSPRIIHAGKQYNLGDFYTKHLKVDWKVATTHLEDAWRAGQADRVPNVKPNLWGAFMQQHAAEKQANALARKRVQDEWKKEREKIRATYKSVVSGGRVGHAVRAAARGERLAAEDRARTHAQDKLAALRPVSRAEAFREFLTKMANAGDLGALSELRRLAPVKPRGPHAILGRERDTATFPLPGYVVDRDGSVAYRIQNRTAVVDAPRQIQLVQASEKAYDAALRVALARYGNTLTLHGDDQFVRGLAKAAERNNVKVTLYRGNGGHEAPLVVQPRTQRAGPRR